MPVTNLLPAPSTSQTTDIYAVPVRKSAVTITPDAGPDLSAITVSGVGLHICEEDKIAGFVIDGGGQTGQPDVRIEGGLPVVELWTL